MFNVARYLRSTSYQREALCRILGLGLIKVLFL
jgi:hypothetical protein